MKFQDFDNEYKADRERVESFNGGDEYKIQHYNDELRVFTFTNNLSFSKRDGRLIIINFFKNIYDNKRKEIMDTIINYKTFFMTGVSDEIDKNYIVSIEFRKSNLFDYQTRSTEHLHMDRNTLDDVKAKLESGKPYFRFSLHEDTNKNFYGYLVFTPVSKFLKSKSAYRAKEAKENTFFEDIQLVSKAVKNNSCQTVIPTTKRDC